jgi:antitoxin MazE
MRSSLQRIGNSQGVIIPKPLLSQVGLTDDVDMSVEDDAIVLRRPSGHPRQGWAEASKAIADAGDDLPEWREFGNAGDRELVW